MAAGVALGLLIPGFFQAIAQLEYAHVNLVVAVFIWVMIYPMMIQIDWSAVKQVGRRPRGLMLTLVINWLVKPFSMAALAVLFFEYLFAPWVNPQSASEYIAGMILLGVAPCTAMVFVWSQLVKGDASYTLVQVSINDLIMVVAFVGFLGGHSQALFGQPLLGGVVAACVVTWFTFLPSFVFILAGGPLVESTRHMPSLTGPLQGIMAAVIGMIVYLAGVFARQTWLPGGWHMLPDLGALALTVLATWLLIRKQLSVFKLLGLCTALGLVWQLVV